MRYKGETESDDAAFKTFASTAWGYRAMFVLLHTYRVRHRIATLRGMIARWAPPSENDTGAYLRTVVRRSGVDPAAEIDTRDGPTMTRIAAAMARVENGVEPDEAEIAEGWRLFSADF